MLDELDGRRILRREVKGLCSKRAGLRGWVTGGELPRLGEQRLHGSGSGELGQHSVPAVDQLGRAGEIDGGAGSVTRAEGGVGCRATQPQGIVADRSRALHRDRAQELVNGFREGITKRQLAKEFGIGYSAARRLLEKDLE